MRQYVSLFLIVLTCAATGAAQQSGAPSAGQEPPAVFGTEVNFVEVHAIVTDEKEAFVKDLTAEDFEILEDGRPQKTAVFSLVDLPVERPLTAVGPDGAGRAGRARGDRARSRVESMCWCWTSCTPIFPGQRS